MQTTYSHTHERSAVGVHCTLSRARKVSHSVVLAEMYNVNAVAIRRTKKAATTTTKSQKSKHGAAAALAK